MAKLLKAVIDDEQPGTVLSGKQAIAYDMDASRSRSTDGTWVAPPLRNP